jgi:hypothetical protein
MSRCSVFGGGGKTRWRNLFGFFDVGGILEGLIFVIYFEIKR